MIRIVEKSADNIIILYKTCINSANNVTLVFNSIGKNKKYEFEATNMSTDPELYKFSLDLSAMSDGEYELVVSDGDAFIQSELVQIGDIIEKRRTTNKVYNENIEYIEYEG